MLPAVGAQGLPRGAKVRVKLGEIDEITLDISGTVTERLDVEIDESPDPLGEDDGESEMAAGPISIAVDVNEPQTDTAAAVPVAG